MNRWIALVVLLVLAVGIVAPALAPATAYAATTDPNGFPPIPWAQVWSLVKNFGPMIIYLIDAIISALGGADGVGGGGAPNPPPPPPPPSEPQIVTPVAWCGAPVGAFA